MEALAYSLLCLIGTTGAFILYHQRTRLRTQAMVTAVALGLSGLYGGLAVLTYSLNMPLKEIAYMFGNIHLYISAPLIFFALLDQAVGWNFSRPIWGRILLGLCAFFELFRRADLMDEYNLGLAVIYIAGCAGIAVWKKQPWLALISGVWVINILMPWSGFPALAMLVISYHYLKSVIQK